MQRYFLILGFLLLCAFLADAQEIEDTTKFNCERLTNGQIRCWRAEGRDLSLIEKEAELASMKAYVARWERYKTGLSWSDVQDISARVNDIRTQVPDIRKLSWGQICQAVISAKQSQINELESALADLR